jgi:hypothetical protein
MGAAGSGGTSRDALLAMVAQGLVLSRAQIRELTQVDRRAGKKAKKAAKKVGGGGGGSVARRML